MDYEIQSQSGNVTQYQFKIAKNKLDELFTKNALKKSRESNLRVPGFRPGKAPLDIVINTFREEIDNQTRIEVAQNFVYKTLGLSPNSIAGVVYQNFELSKNEPDQFLFTLEIRLKPTFDFADFFSKFKVVNPDVDVENAIDLMLLQLRHQRSTFVKTEESANVDSEVVFTSEAVDAEGNPSSQFTFAEPVKLVVGDANFVTPEFSTAFIGRKAGEEFEWLHIDTDENGEALNTITVKIKVAEVLERILPELDAEFVKVFLQRDGNINDLREEIRRNIVREIKSYTSTYIIEQLDRHVSTVYGQDPAVLASIGDESVEREARTLLDRQIHAQYGNKLTKEIYQQIINSVNQEELKTLATQSLVHRYFYDSLLEKFELQWTPEEYDALVAEYAVMFEYPEGFKEELNRNPEQKAEFINRLTNNKIAALALEKAGEVEKKSLSYLTLLQLINSQFGSQDYLAQQQ